MTSYNQHHPRGPCHARDTSARGGPSAGSSDAFSSAIRPRLSGDRFLPPLA